ncbi:MAG: hypothetical protein EXS67_02355 [Candidatus Margulisbacteria bacterium]|nr:hypothetical protein [Candidatus Margulisiibacteriota bacterium]
MTLAKFWLMLSIIILVHQATHTLLHSESNTEYKIALTHSQYAISGLTDMDVTSFFSTAEKLRWNGSKENQTINPWGVMFGAESTQWPLFANCEVSGTSKASIITCQIGGNINLFSNTDTLFRLKPAIGFLFLSLLSGKLEKGAVSGITYQEDPIKAGDTVKFNKIGCLASIGAEYAKKFGAITVIAGVDYRIIQMGNNTFQTSATFLQSGTTTEINPNPIFTPQGIFPYVGLTCNLEKTFLGMF